jgi:hypothetical protein
MPNVLLMMLSKDVVAVPTAATTGVCLIGHPVLQLWYTVVSLVLRSMPWSHHQMQHRTIPSPTMTHFHNGTSSDDATATHNYHHYHSLFHNDIFHRKKRSTQTLQSSPSHVSQMNIPLNLLKIGPIVLLLF